MNYFAIISFVACIAAAHAGFIATPPAVTYSRAYSIPTLHTQYGPPAISPPTIHTEYGPPALSPPTIHTEYGPPAVSPPKIHTEYGLPAISPPTLHTEYEPPAVSPPTIHTEYAPPAITPPVVVAPFPSVVVGPYPPAVNTRYTAPIVKFGHITPVVAHGVPYRYVAPVAIAHGANHHGFEHTVIAGPSGTITTTRGGAAPFVYKHGTQSSY